ncbi:hypothetical protein B0F87_11427 [Methylobacter tundripaludum]|uniref:Uncharacterized protein n=1 Tax=Methylobacter tundripaludum TaxID=173365 RepID=A0A2S6H7M2_9GAMM|nr:hypothetical protein [Methylobacter tundripaludum]PPK73431.1 hypothetical protein B0F87_11427 [Methylobacter tundripaludum]
MIALLPIKTAKDLGINLSPHTPDSLRINDSVTLSPAVSNSHLPSNPESLTPDGFLYNLLMTVSSKKQYNTLRQKTDVELRDS